MGLIKLAVLGGVVYWAVNRSKECHRTQDGHWESHRGPAGMYRQYPQSDAYPEPPPYHAYPSQRREQPPTTAEKLRTTTTKTAPQQQRMEVQYEDVNERPLYIEQRPRAIDHEYYASQRGYNNYPRQYPQPRVQDVSDMPPTAAWDMRGLRRADGEPQVQQQQQQPQRARSGWFWL